MHDYLLVMRGAERTFAAMAECWPDAGIHTTLYDPLGTESRFEGREVRTSWLQNLRVRQRGFRLLLPFFPGAVERLAVGGHKLVVSSSSAFAHGVHPDPDATHVCFCHTPFRYAWHERAAALAEAPRGIRPLLDWQLDRMRRWDVEAAGRVTHYIANSRLVAERIARCYGREASVIHPPVDVERFSRAEPEDFFLVVGELVAHKRTAVALEAAKRAERPVRVVGTGPELDRLQAEFRDAEFLGRVSDDQLESLYSSARALLVPNVEEFGIAAVEAQAAGRPVVAVGRGGALETVVDGTTGLLLERGDADEFAQVLRDVDFDRFDPGQITAHATEYSATRFKQRLAAEVNGLSEVGGSLTGP